MREKLRYWKMLYKIVYYATREKTFILQGQQSHEWNKFFSCLASYFFHLRIKKRICLPRRGQKKYFFDPLIEKCLLINTFTQNLFRKKKFVGLHWKKYSVKWIIADSKAFPKVSPLRNEQFPHYWTQCEPVIWKKWSKKLL